MSRALATSVLAVSPDGDRVLLCPGDRLPPWAAEAIGDADVWAGVVSDEPAPSPDETPEAAPTSAANGESSGEGGMTDRPAGNASLEEWTGYALSKGASESDLEGMTRNDIRDAYGS